MTARLRRWHWEGGRWSPPVRARAATQNPIDGGPETARQSFDATLETMLQEAAAYRQAKRSPDEAA